MTPPKPRPARRPPLAPMLLFAAAGCTLVDQNTFNPHAGDAPVIPPAPVVAAAPPRIGPPPLLVIPPAATGYEPTLRQAVAAARARKPGVLFDVVEMQPLDPPPDAPIGRAAAAVAHLVAAAGVPQANIRLAARPEAGVTPGEVRVYVR